MTIGERIEQLIDAQGIKKVAFAAALKIDQSYVTKLIKGTNVPSPRLIESICQKFNVRREWLETGEGEMYTHLKNEIIQQLLTELKLDEKSMEFLENFLRLNEANRKMVVAGLEQLAKMYFRSEHIEHLTTKPDNEKTANERAETVRQEAIDEIAAQKKATLTSSAFTGTSGTSKKFRNSS